MSKEYILAVVCIFLLCISADYYLCINLKLTSTVKTIVKSLVGYFILSAVLGKGWFLLLKLVTWLLGSTIGLIVLVILGISSVVIVPLAIAWCLVSPRK
ncbi:hypothetical protein [Ruminococcus sp. 2227st1_E6_2227SCRN_220401]|uniref:hypothetical protein n=1 Tax=unclassified Ruminococcus TaxID=2608920 RepID=UPI00319E7ACB